MRKVAGFFVSLSIFLVLGLPASASAGISQPTPYIALGDSVAAGDGDETGNDGYVGRLFEEYENSIGANQLKDFAIGGATSTTLINDQLQPAITEIGMSSDTRAVTITIGGNDILRDCAGKIEPAPPATCPLRENLNRILRQLKAALHEDPGEESFTIMAYHNPANGLTDEALYDGALLGANLKAEVCDTGADVGLNDLIYQEAALAGIAVADPYTAFKQNGQAWMADTLHPNAAGYTGIVPFFRNPVSPAVCPPVSSDPDPDPDPEPDPDPDPAPPVDRTAPRTKLLKGPVRVSNRKTVRFRFGSNEKGGRFECRLDRGKFRRCSSPKVYRKVRKGKHVFRVRAIDAAGNRDRTPVRFIFRIQ